MRVVRCVCGRLSARCVAGGWMEARDATASDPVQGARQGCCVGVSGEGSGVRTGSAASLRRFPKFLAHPDLPSRPRRAPRVGRGRDGGREGADGEGPPREARVAGDSQLHLPGPPAGPCRAGAEPSARGGGPAQLGPAWGGDRSCGDPLAAHGARVEWERGGCGPESLPPQPRGRSPAL